ncbi:MAG: hypothetical protein K940chlam3_01352 [Chlamydiae bacterium]|nr:hypothetical protein [Chlamydiota bacterium]
MLWDFANLNYIAIIIAAVARIIIGMVWYSPAVFGNMWLNLAHRDPTDLKNVNMKVVWGFINSFVVALILAGFIAVTSELSWLTGGEMSWWYGACVGFWAWLGFAATTMMGGVIWENKHLNLFAIHNGEMVISYSVMGAIIGSF